MYHPDDPDEHLETKLALLGAGVWREAAYPKDAAYKSWGKPWRVCWLREPYILVFTDDRLQRFTSKREALERALDAFAASAETFDVDRYSELLARKPAKKKKPKPKWPK